MVSSQRRTYRRDVSSQAVQIAGVAQILSPNRTPGDKTKELYLTETVAKLTWWGPWFRPSRRRRHRPWRRGRRRPCTWSGRLLRALPCRPLASASAEQALLSAVFGAVIAGPFGAFAWRAPLPLSSWHGGGGGLVGGGHLGRGGGRSQGQGGAGAEEGGEFGHGRILCVEVCRCGAQAALGAHPPPRSPPPPVSRMTESLDFARGRRC